MSDEAKHKTKGAKNGLLRHWPWLLLAGAFALWIWTRPGGQELEAGQLAPSLSLPADPGETFTLADHRGEVVVLSFWATWCPSCRREGPTLSRVAERTDAHVVGVSVDRQALAPVAEAARQIGMTYPIALADAAAVEAYGVELLPTVFIIDREGTIRETFRGTVSEDRLLSAIAAAGGR